MLSFLKHRDKIKCKDYVQILTLVINAASNKGLTFSIKEEIV